MSHLHGSSLIAGAHVFGGGGLGTLAESIPANGDKGPGYAYKGLSFPADNGKEIRGQVITPPSGGAFFAYNDTSYTLIGASDGPHWFDWKLWVDGVPSTVDIGYGAGVARVFLQVGPAYSVVSATTDDAVFSGGSRATEAPFTQEQLDYMLLYIQENLVVPTAEQVAAAVLAALQAEGLLTVPKFLALK